MYKLVIFDLDGTLLYTLKDLAVSTNHALEECGFPTHPVEAYNHFVGNGIRKLFERALPEEARNEDNILKIRTLFLAHYDRHCCDHTRPYEGVPRLLEQLQERGVQMAVASNKYQQAASLLISHFFPTLRFAAVYGQREGVPLKPNPAVVEEIMKEAGVAREETLYVGDSGVDITTARNAGVSQVSVTWGFCTRKELEENKPYFLCESPCEIWENFFLPRT